MLPISAGERDLIHSDLAAGDVVMASAFCADGDQWTVERDTGGDTSAPSTTPLNGGAPLTVYVVNTRDFIIAFSASESAVPDAQWRYLSPGSPDLDENDVIASVTTSARVIIRSVLFDGINTVGVAEYL